MAEQGKGGGGAEQVDPYTDDLTLKTASRVPNVCSTTKINLPKYTSAISWGAYFK